MSGKSCIIALGRLLLSGFREIGNTFEIADDAGGIVHIFTAAFWAAVHIAFGDVSAVIADGIGNIDCPVGAAGFYGNIEKIPVLFFGQMLGKIEMQGGAAVQIAGHFAAVENEFIDGFCFVLDEIEIAVIAVARDNVAILFIPLCVFDTEIFRQFCYF